MVERSTDRNLHEEAAWVAQALSGDAQGFEALMRRYHAPLARMLHAVLRNREDVDDLVQETFLRAWRFLHRFDPSRPFGPWLLKIGVNLARNHLRRGRSRRELSLDDAPVGDSGDSAEPFEGPWLADTGSADALAHRTLLEETRKALEALPDEFRVVLEMRLLGEMSYQEISDALEVPIGTVMSRLNRGRRRIQEALAGLAIPAAAEWPPSGPRRAAQETP